MRTKPHSIRDVKVIFEKMGYKLLESTFKNNQTKMCFKCFKHQDKQLSISYNEIKKGRKCPYCEKEDKEKYNIIKKEFSQIGYRLISKKYVNNNQELNYICKKHPKEILKTSYSKFKKGETCEFCRKENRINYKGGITSLNKYLRGCARNWTEETLAKYEYKCAITQEPDLHLHVHHSTPFHEIRDAVLKELSLPVHENIGGYQPNEIMAIVSKFNEKHKQIIGVPLKKEIHNLFHQTYGYNATMSDLYEFKARYLAGEFEGKETDVQQLSLII